MQPECGTKKKNKLKDSNFIDFGSFVNTARVELVSSGSHMHKRMQKNK